MSQDKLISDEDFLKFLSSEELKKEYNDDAYVGLYKQHDGELLIDKKHRNIVNACIYPFAHKGKLTELGYYFIRTEPLLEQDVSDVDFVIESPTKQLALFGEAKSSTRNASGIISEMKKRKKSIEDHKQHLQQTLLPNSKNYEYVLATEAIEARDLYASVIRSEDKNIIWEYGGNEEQLLSIFALPEDISKHKDKVMHSDDDLNKNLIRVKTSTKFKNFFPKSHPVSRLSVLTWIDKDFDDDEVNPSDSFSFEDVLKIFNKELENFPQDYIEKMAQNTLEYGVNIGFITQLDAKDYKIVINSNDPATREQDLKEKWIDYAIKKEKKKKQDALRIKLQTKMREKNDKMFPPLESFEKDQN